MCGITGFIDFNKRSSKQQLLSMTESLAHRGPDGQGLFFEQHPQANIGLGHRRLSIIDLSALGDQPMHDPETGWTLIFNGEIYNYQEIQKELLDLGCFFRSSSDTEVVIKAIAHWGLEKALEQFIGMFAFVLYQPKQNQLFFARDRAGVKPFYFYQYNDLLLFASELKAFSEHSDFKKEINPSSVKEFMSVGYISAPNCIFQHTQKLTQGHFGVLNLADKNIRIEKYWAATDYFKSEKLDLPEPEIIDKTEDLLKSAFNYRMVSDVPIGVFLSGGYDSTAVTALLQAERTEKLKTFTIGFEDKSYNEATYAKTIAEHIGTDHTEYYCKMDDAKEIIATLPDIYDEPFGDSSAIPTTLVCKLSRQAVKVVLSADGGDESFAGYNFYQQTLKFFSYYQKIPGIGKKLIQPLMGKGMAHLAQKTFKQKYNLESRINKFGDALGAKDFFDFQTALRPAFSKKEMNAVLTKKSNGYHAYADQEMHRLGATDPLQNMLAFDYVGYMTDDILTKVDRASMSVGLESREPLIDHRIIEWAAKIPATLKLKDHSLKYILKKIVHRHVPELLLDRPKKGFSIPIKNWFREDLRFYIDQYLSEAALKEHGLFNVSEMISIKKDYLDGKPINFNKIWYPLMFQMWYARWMKN